MIVCTAVPASYGADYVVIAKATKVYDNPGAKSYVTTSRAGVEVEVSPGMVFKRVETRQGWDMVEYTPGLRGFILSTAEVPASSLLSPSAGSYKVANEPSRTIDIRHEGDEWSATSSDGKTYSGSGDGNVIVFIDASANIVYSLVRTSQGSQVFTYDNAVTGFF